MSDVLTRGDRPAGPTPGRPSRARAAPPSPRYTVGITIFVNADGDLGLFENGLRQNVVFLNQLFKASPSCGRVLLLNHGDGEPGLIPEGLGVTAADIVRTADVLEELDYVIVIGAAMDRATAAALRARGCKLINYKGGNGAVISLEAIIAKPPRADAERYFDVGEYDAIWMTPQHIRTYKGWCETIYRCPVHETPQVWSPLFIENRPEEVRERFGYRTGARPWRVGIMDPNITVMKTSHTPMLVCEAAYRARAEAFAAIYVTNGWPHRENAHFASFLLSLSAAKAGVMTLEPRFISADFLGAHADAVVTHQWENGLNYLYYEVLYGGYPLIHNSPFLKAFGYYYPDFDAEAGAAALVTAMRDHDDILPAYRARNAALFAEIDPLNPANIALHERLLEQVSAS